VYRLTLIMFAIALVGCSNDSQDRVPLDGTLEEIVEELPPELQSQLDSANAAYRDRDYETALVLFERVTDEAPGLAAGWYGIGMTHTAMGNHAAGLHPRSPSSTPPKPRRIRTPTRRLLKKYRDHRDGVLRVLVEAD
jgi:hypothetical protein